MAQQVIKKDGSRESFDPGKIRNAIRGAAARVKIPQKRKNEIVEQVTSAVVQIVNSKDEVKTSEIRENILTELDRVEPKISKSWRDYEQKKR